MPRKCPDETCSKDHMTVADLKEQLSLFPDNHFVVIEAIIDTPISNPIVDPDGIIDYVMVVEDHCQMKETVAITNFHCPSKKVT